MAVAPSLQSSRPRKTCRRTGILVNDKESCSLCCGMHDYTVSSHAVLAIPIFANFRNGCWVLGAGCPGVEKDVCSERSRPKISPPPCATICFQVTGVRFSPEYYVNMVLLAIAAGTIHKSSVLLIKHSERASDLNSQECTYNMHKVPCSGRSGHALPGAAQV